MKIFVTGGLGYIGYSLIETLDKLDVVDSVTIYDNLHKSNFHYFFNKDTPLQKTRFVKGDILNQLDLADALQDTPDVVIHLAASVDFPYHNYDYTKYDQVNHYGTVNLYQALKGSGVKKVIHVSSAAVYGFQEVKNEETLPNPSNHYGISKLRAEKYLELLSEELNLVTLRSANVFGYNPLFRTDAVINNFFLEALLYNKIQIQGKGNQSRPFIALDTLVQTICSTMSNDTMSGTYNLVEFNATLNEIRDFLKEQQTDLEFTYQNPSADLPSLSMESSKLAMQKDMSLLLNEEYQNFKNSFRL